MGRGILESKVVSEPKRVRNLMVNAWMKIERSSNIEGGARHSATCFKITQF